MTHSHSIYILENFPSFSGHFSEKSLSSGKSNVEEAYQYSTSTPKDHQPLSPRIPRSLFLRAGLTLRQGQCLLWDVIFFFSLFKVELSCREKELEMEGEVTKGQLTRDSGTQGDGHLKVAVVYLLHPKFKFGSIRAGCLLHFQLRLCFPIPLPD